MFLSGISINFDFFQLFHPQSRAGVGGHAPVATGGEGDGAHLGPVGQAGALELLGEETAGKDLQPVEDGLIGITALEGVAGQGVDTPGGGAVSEHVVQEKVVQLIGAHDILGLLGDLSLAVRGQQLRGHGGVQNVVQNGLDLRVTVL